MSLRSSGPTAAARTAAAAALTRPAVARKLSQDSTPPLAGTGAPGEPGSGTGTETMSSRFAGHPPGPLGPMLLVGCASFAGRPSGSGPRDEPVLLAVELAGFAVLAGFAWSA